ncbi:hypothetical protein [Altererythrobacter sp.]|uniref:hypothetical protein n=1 Tax=Altererythrobacter sp. TaxID=1872480 RepID=UPI003CFC62E2
MNEQSKLPPTAHASPAALAKASLGAVTVAAAVVTLFVLPAETGIDPTGVGGAIGLAGMSAGEAKAATVAPPSSHSATPTQETIEARVPWREDEETIELAPHSGIEVKSHMTKGDSFVFKWESSGGPVKVDMHGEPPNAADDEFTSYWVAKQSEGQAGTFVAPFDGNHGWYWRNKGDTPVTVKLQMSGYYPDLYRP